MLDRRRLIAALALLATPGIARAAGRAARINWPGPPGALLHGVMAIPDKAHGRQPAVLVIGDGGTADPLAAWLVDRLADAGLVACLIDLSANNVAVDAPAALDDALASVRWLATNRYATGRVGALGIGRGATLVRRLAVSAGDALTAAATLGGEALPVTATYAAMLIEPLAPPLASATLPPSADESRAWEQSLARAIAFFREHLA